MSAVSLPTGKIPVLIDLTPLPHNSSPQARADWCAQLARECIRCARLARSYDLPTHDWLLTARLFRFARNRRRARAKRAS